VDRDEALRTACFARLTLLRAEWGDELPHTPALRAGFPFRGARVPFLSQPGIFRAAVQRGPAALSIKTTIDSPYDDSTRGDDFIYAYRKGSIDHADNRALRAAHDLQVPLVYFYATRRARYEAFYPCFVIKDDPVARHVRVAKGEMVGPVDEQEPLLSNDPIERRYANRDVRVRMHQGRFRGVVLPAYQEQCAICRLKEARLLDAAHIIGDVAPRGEAQISNGLTLCSIHHRAFDSDLVGISPDYTVHVSRRLLDDDDGPMLDVLKTAQSTTIHTPRRREWQPDRERLASRFERFQRVS
jgi:putative restriction endonuclease